MLGCEEITNYRLLQSNGQGQFRHFIREKKENKKAII